MKIMEKCRDFIFHHICFCALLLCILPLLFVGKGLFGVVEVEETPVDAESEDLIVVGFSQLGSESVWRTAHTASIQNALTKERGYFLIFDNARQKQENQIKAIRSFISQQVDYIVLSPIAEDGWDTVLQEAKDAGIPVILTDRMVNVEDESLYTAWVGTDSREEGEKAGKWLEGYLREKGREDEDINIVVLLGTLGSTAQLEREAGFAAVAAKHPNWHILESAAGEFTATRGKEVMQDLLSRYRDIDVLVSQNDDMTFGAIEAMRERQVSFGEYGKVAIISFDAVHDALMMVNDGRINVDIECNPEQGEALEEVIQELERGVETEKNRAVDENVFTRENVADYIGSRTY